MPSFANFRLRWTWNPVIADDRSRERHVAYGQIHSREEIKQKVKISSRVFVTGICRRHFVQIITAACILLLYVLTKLKG